MMKRDRGVVGGVVKSQNLRDVIYEWPLSEHVHCDSDLENLVGNGISVVKMRLQKHIPHQLVKLADKVAPMTEFINGLTGKSSKVPMEVKRKINLRKR